MEAGWPFGEALTEARERKLLALWETAPGPQREVPSMHEKQMRESNYGHENNKSFGKAHITGPLSEPTEPSQCCPAWNDHRGCTRKQRECPVNLAHKCSAMTKQNTLCGQWQHCKMKCPHLLHKESNKGNKGGKGEGKGQSKNKGKGNKGH